MISDPRQPNFPATLYPPEPVRGRVMQQPLRPESAEGPSFAKYVRSESEERRQEKLEKQRAASRKYRDGQAKYIKSLFKITGGQRC